MSDLDRETGKVDGWLQPLADDAAPCGPDLEYDNDFLALTQAVEGKPETQFGPAEAPDWRTAFELAESMLDRTRDLRIAINWLRAGLHVKGFDFLPVGLKLMVGLVEQLWEHVHPLPDPDDNDPYGRVNALTLLSEAEVLLADMRTLTVVSDRSVGELSIRQIEVALAHVPARSDETELGRGQVDQMLAAALEKSPQIRETATQAAELVEKLVESINSQLGLGVAPDLKPLVKTVKAVLSVMPAPAGEEGSGDGDGEDAGVGTGAPGRKLAGTVSSREDAIRAIDLVCQYLERTEPTNPAPLFLRRAKHLIGHNFLQLMKELAPDALAGVARVVGVDPESVESPEGS